MKATTKRVLAVLVALVIVASLAACAGGGNQSTTNSPAANTPSGNTTTPAAPAAPPAEDGPLTPYAEPITITWAVQASQVQKFFDGDTYEDNRWSRKIKEELNIDLEVAFSADISTDAYRNKINAVLASGDLPDITRWSDRTFYNQAYEAGYLADLTDLFEQYATPGLKSYRERFPDSFTGASFNGRLHGFPYMVDNFHQAVYLWIRDDWLAASGKEAPTTIEEMVELARIFTSGDGSTYGLALNNKVYNTNFGTIGGIAAAYGAPLYGNNVFYRGSDGKMTHGLIQPGLKDALSIVRDMYAEGLIDPEFVVKDGGILEADVASGKQGMMYHMNWGTWYPFNIIFEADGVITRPYPVPTASGSQRRVGIESNLVGEVFFLNSNTKNPEAFVKILNLYDTTVNESNDPQDFQDYWADEQYRLCPAFVGMPNELYAPQLLPALEANDPSSLASGILPYYTWVKDFEAGTDTNPNAYGTWGQMFSWGSMAIALDYQSKGQLVQSVMANVRPDIWMTNGSVLESMAEITFTDIITGAKPLDAFDQFVQDWLANGGQQTLDELETMYP